MKNIFRRAFILILAALVTGEVFLRFYLPATHRDIKAFDAYFDLYQGDAFVGYVPRPGYQMKHSRGSYSPTTKKFTAPLKIKVNHLGFRGAEFTAIKKPGTFRVFCLGGSETWGYGVNDMDSWPAQLEQILKKRTGKEIEVINAGVPGYTTFHSLANLTTRLLDFEPDLIIVCHSWNDLKFMSYLSPERQFGTMGLAGDFRYPAFLQRLLHRSYLYIFLKTVKRMALQKWQIQSGAVESSGSGKMEADTSYGFKVYQRNLCNMAAVAQTNHVRVIFVDPLTLIKAQNTEEETGKIAAYYTGLSMEKLREAMEKIDGILKSAADFEKIKYINLNDKIHSNLEVLMDHIHPTQNGHQMIAEALSQSVEEEILQTPKA